MAYLLDSNVFIEAKRRYYGFDFCPAFWDWLIEAAGKGLVFSVEKVRDELITGGDELSDWPMPWERRFFSLPMRTRFKAWSLPWNGHGDSAIDRGRSTPLPKTRMLI